MSKFFVMANISPRNCNFKLSHSVLIVQCWRSLRITSSSNHQRLWTANILYTEQLPNPRNTYHATGLIVDTFNVTGLIVDTFHVTGLILHPLKTSENFLMFLEGIERDQWHKLGMRHLLYLLKHSQPKLLWSLEFVTPCNYEYSTNTNISIFHDYL